MTAARLRLCLAAACALLLVAAPAVADVLQLKDGRVIRGTYLGGTQETIRFLAGDRVELFARGEVASISFDDAAPAPRPAATTPAPPPPAPPPPAPTPAPPVTEPPPRTSLGQVTVPAGTRILVRMIDSVDSESNKVGDRFRASLEEDIVAGERVAVRRGADVYGRLVEVREAGRIAGRSELRLQLTDILIHNQLQPISSGEYEVAGEGRGADTAKRVGIGAAVGAAVGGVTAGGKGAAIGAGIGAAAGAAIQILTKGERVRVPSETLLEFTLTQGFTIRVNP